MRYQVEFERVGRNHQVPDLEFEGSEEELLDKVLSYCRPHLVSRGFVIGALASRPNVWAIVDMGRKQPSSAALQLKRGGSRFGLKVEATTRDGVIYARVVEKDE